MLNFSCAAEETDIFKFSRKNSRRSKKIFDRLLSKKPILVWRTDEGYSPVRRSKIH
jgi:hypothetical protein